MHAERSLYYLLALLALVGTWTCNIRFMLEGHPGLAFVTDNLATPANLSITLDLLALLILLFPWMVREARRYGVKYVWAYLIGSMLIAISVTFPLFLAARHRAKEGKENRDDISGVTALYPLVSGAGFVLVAFYRLQAWKAAGGDLGAIWQDWFHTWATASITIDWIALGVTLLVFAGYEQARHHFARFWGFLLLNVFGFSVGFPWILRAADIRKESTSRQ